MTSRRRDGAWRGGLGRLPALPLERRVEPRLLQEGDHVGHRDGEGQIWFHGRNDHQIQFRGHRLELSAVEAHLIRHPFVSEAVVCMTQTSTGQSKLIAFVRPLKNEIPSEETLRKHCEHRLPHYAVPSLYCVRHNLPLSSNGKISRSELLKTLP